MFGESKELFLKGIDFVFTEAIFRTCGEYEVCTCAHIHTYIRMQDNQIPSACISDQI